MKRRSYQRSSHGLEPALRSAAAGALLASCLSIAGCSSEIEGRSTDEGTGANLDGVIFGEGADPDGTRRGGFNGEVCAGQSAGAEIAPSVLQLLVDTSGSMDQNAPGVRRSKWEVTRSAVLNAIDGMPADTALGVVFYPNVSNETRPCFDERTAVSVGRLAANNSQQRQQVRTAGVLFGGFVVTAFVLGWLMYPLPL